MRNILNRRPFRVTMDRCFEEVVRQCQKAPRDGEGTWITDDIVEAYVALNDLGVAHSVEAWRDDELVGGLYGVSLGRMFLVKACFPPTPTRQSGVRSIGALASLEQVWACGLPNHESTPRLFGRRAMAPGAVSNPAEPVPSRCPHLERAVDPTNTT